VCSSDLEIIDAAIEGFEAQKQRLDARILELRSMRDGGSLRDGAGETQTPAPAKTGRRKRKFSPDALRRMREAQQRRWAKVRGEQQPSAPATSAPARKKSRLSAAGRKAIQEALRKRWAQKKAAGDTKPAAKKAARKKTASAKSAPAKTATE